MTAGKGDIISATNLAGLLDISLARVGQLAKQGVLEKQHGKYELAAAVTAYIRFLRGQKKELGEYGKLFEKEKWRQKKRENDVEEKLLAPVEVIEQVVEKCGAQMIPILEGLPLALKRAWPEITGDQITLVKTAIAECRNTIADMEVEL